MYFYKSKFFYALILFILLFGINLLLGVNWNTTAVADNKIRYLELKAVIYLNSGFAHLSRGMNQYTIDALKNKVTEADIPILQALTDDKDHVTSMTATEVLLIIRAKNTK